MRSEAENYGDRLILLVLMLALVFLTLIFWSLGQHRFEAPTLFRDVSIKSGITSRGLTFGNPAVADFDGDGYVDFFFGNHFLSPPVMYRNTRKGTFSEVIRNSGVDFSQADRHGTAWGDFDNDGDLDLYVSTGADRGQTLGKKTDQLYLNDGNGLFTSVAEYAGTQNSNGRSRCVNCVDFDRDGLLDIFVKNYDSPNALYRNNGNGTFTDYAAETGLSNLPGTASTWADFDNDRDMDLFLTGATLDQLWRNDDGIFTDITKTAGIQAEYPAGATGSWGDYNNDGFLDLYVSRRIIDEADLYLTADRIIRFADDEPVENGIDFTTVSTEVTFNIYSNYCHHPERIFIGSKKRSTAAIPFTLQISDSEGKPTFLPGKDYGYFIWNDGQEWHVRWSGTGGHWINFSGEITAEADFPSVRALHLVRQAGTARSQLYRNNHDGTFTDVTDKTSAGNVGNGRGVVWGDFDNDGFLDLFVVNAGTILSNAPGALFRNIQGRKFERIENQGGIIPPDDGRGDGAAWVDYDNDGALDLLLTNGASFPFLYRTKACLTKGPHLLYRNQGSANRWLKVHLVGTKSNRSGLGARVVAQAGNLRIMREMDGGGGGQFYSQGITPIHFGVGNNLTIQTVTVFWPSGERQILRNIPSNQTITITEGENR